MNKTPEAIEAFLSKFLPSFEMTYCESQKHEILDLQFEAAGVAVKLHSGLEVFGSSSSLHGSPLAFAAYECLERYVIQTRLGQVTADEEKFRFSLSNGIALHDSLEEAKRSAHLELIERNEVLKSWYYNTPVSKVEFDAEKVFGRLMCDHYEFKVTDFSTLINFNVVGIFAFPKKAGLNLIFGLGCESTQEKAVEKAQKEFLTRLGFLWGEEVSLAGLDHRTPAYHQEFYLLPENHEHLREWLEGSYFEKKEVSIFGLSKVSYENLTPAEWKEEFSIVKASSPDSIPLFFGEAPRESFDFTHRYDIPHPIA